MHVKPKRIPVTFDDRVLEATFKYLSHITRADNVTVLLEREYIRKMAICYNVPVSAIYRKLDLVVNVSLLQEYQKQIEFFIKQKEKALTPEEISKDFGKKTTKKLVKHYIIYRKEDVENG